MVPGGDSQPVSLRAESSAGKVFLGVLPSSRLVVRVYLHPAPHFHSGCSAASGPLLWTPHPLLLGQHSVQHLSSNKDQNSAVRACREGMCIFGFVMLLHVCLYAFGEAH